MSDEEILPCVMCDQHHEQMLMLSCVHDPCINCAAMHYCSTQSPDSRDYVCFKCKEQTQLDTSSVFELQRVYQILKNKKKYDYRRNLGGFSHGQPQEDSQHYLNPSKPTSKRSQHSKKVETDIDNISNPVSNNPYSVPIAQPYTPISQPAYSNNLYNNIIARKAQQGTYMCETHPQEQLSYFCFDCISPICPQCAIHGTHRQHEVQTTRKSIKIIRKNLQECNEGLSQQTTATVNTKENHKSLSRDLTEQNKRDKEVLRNHFAGLRHILNEKQKQFEKSLNLNYESNANLIKNQMSQCDKAMEFYGSIRRNIDSTLTKDDLTILQEYKKRERQAKSAIESSSNKPHQNDLSGLKEVDYGLFKDEMDQLSGITQALRLTIKSHRS